MSCNDIFTVSACEAEFNRCRTNEQVQIFLWQQLGKLKQFTYDTYQNQLTINQNNSTAITGVVNDVGNNKSVIATLKSNIDSLNKAMETLRADYNNFNLNVDKSLNLYQSTINNLVKNINSLTADNQALENRVGVLESQTDLNKLQEIIKSYRQISENVDQTISNMINSERESDEFKNKVESIIKENTYTVSGENGIELVTSEQLSSWYDSFVSDVNTRINKLNSDFNEFKAKVNKTVSDNESYMREKLDQINEGYNNSDNEIKNTVDNLSKKVDANNNYLKGEIADLHSELSSYNDASVNRDGVITGKLEASEKSLALKIDQVDSDSKQRDSELDSKLNGRIDTISGEVDTIKATGKEQWSTINNALETANNAFSIANNGKAGLDTLREQVEANDKAHDSRLKAIESSAPYVEAGSTPVFDKDYLLSTASDNDTVGDLSIVFTRNGNSTDCKVKLTLASGYLFKRGTDVMIAGNETTYSPIITNINNASFTEFYVFTENGGEVLPEKIRIFYSPKLSKVNIKIFSTYK